MKKNFLPLAILILVPLVASAQVLINPGGGSSTTSITIGTTPITGGATTQVLYNLAGVVSSDSGFTRTGVNGTTTIDNGSGAVNILVLSDNATPVWTMADGGAITATQNLNMTGGNVVFTTGVGVSLNAGLTSGIVADRSANTPDTPRLETGSLSNSWHLAESADFNADFNNGRCGTSACNSTTQGPALIIHSGDQVTTEYGQLSV